MKVNACWMLLSLHCRKTVAALGLGTSKAFCLASEAPFEVTRSLSSSPVARKGECDHAVYRALSPCIFPVTVIICREIDIGFRGAAIIALVNPGQ